MNPLNEWTKEELWQRFPVVLCAYDPQWEQWYSVAARELCKQVSGVERITHFGSTSVPGMLAKPIVDVLLEVRADTKPDALKDQMEEMAYFYMPPTDTQKPCELPALFAKGYTPQGMQAPAYHIHVRVLGDYDEPYFCAYLRMHADVAQEYAQLKQALQQQYRNDRDAYTQAKTEFIAKITALAREGNGL